MIFSPMTGMNKRHRMHLQDDLPDCILMVPDLTADGKINRADICIYIGLEINNANELSFHYFPPPRE